MIKACILLLSLQTVACLGYASCISHSITVLPSTPTLPPNGRIIVIGYGMDQKVVKGIIDQYPAFLVSTGKSVPLELVEICTGDFQLVQAILRPKVALEEGWTYRLMIRNLAKDSPLGKYDHKQGKYVPLEWKIEGKSDYVSPKWLESPRELRKHYTMFGCGPSYGVVFGIETNETSGMMVKTWVRAVGESKWRTYYLEVVRDEIEIGLGMCSGEFSLRRAKEYEARFSLVDQAGNSTDYTGAPFLFSRPPEMDNY